MGKKSDMDSGEKRRSGVLCAWAAIWMPGRKRSHKTRDGLCLRVKEESDCHFRR